MKIIKIQGTGPSLSIKFDEPLKIHTNIRIALLVWHFSLATANISAMEGVSCFEMYCKVTDDDIKLNRKSTSQEKKELLFGVCSPEYSRIGIIPSLKGCFDPKEKIFVEVNDNLQSISSISIEIKSNPEEPNILKKVNSSIYLIIN